MADSAWVTDFGGDLLTVDNRLMDIEARNY